MDNLGRSLPLVFPADFEQMVVSNSATAHVRDYFRIEPEPLKRKNSKRSLEGRNFECQRDTYAAKPGTSRGRLNPFTARPKTAPGLTYGRSLSNGQAALQLELLHLEHRLQSAEAKQNGGEGGVDLDPDLTCFESFKDKTKSFFKDEIYKATGDERDALKSSLRNAFFDGGRSALRQAVLFGYYDHVVAIKGVEERDSSVSRLMDMRYPTEWYLGARAIQRQVHLHVGPTNSGKTYHALKRLEEAGDGLYASPLRLLAHEVYSRFQGKDIACNLITGDDVRLSETEAKISSHTVEMVDINRKVEVAVIDEIQMIADPDRGWAWTRAFLATKAQELHLCGEARVVPLIRELTASMGDNLHIHHYERLNPLKPMSRSLRGNLKSLRPGDCVVSFSVLNLHTLKKQIEADTGRRVAIVYGGLPPEIRAQQAALFNDPDNEYDFLVASDAIGMGLNLSIKRIIFEALHKHDGHQLKKLTTSQIKQIAGRAGRFRSANQQQDEGSSVDEEAKNGVPIYKGIVKQSNIGLVTCLDERDLHDIQIALTSEVEPIKQAGIAPPVEILEGLNKSLPTGIPYEYLLQTVRAKALIHPRFFLCNRADEAKCAGWIEHIKGLTIAQRAVLTAAPVGTRTENGKTILTVLSRCLGSRTPVTIADVPELPLHVLEQPISKDREYLAALEDLHKGLITFLWLSYRFRNIFLDQEMAIYAKSMVEDKINATLLNFSANPVLQKRLQAMQDLKVPDTVQPADGDRETEEMLAGADTVSDEELVDSNLPGSTHDFAALAVDWDNPTSSRNFTLHDIDKTTRPSAAARP